MYSRNFVKAYNQLSLTLWDK